MLRWAFWQNWCNGCRPVGAVLIALLLLSVGPQRAWADPSPTPAMLEPVRALGSFMATLPAGRHATMFAGHGVTVIENYAPFIFSGPDAVARWEAGFRQHAAADRLSELAVAFGSAQDFSTVADRAYFCLPTTWTGRTAGKLFEEHGAWSFVLARVGAKWAILGYGWGVTSYVERPK